MQNEENKLVFFWTTCSADQLLFFVNIYYEDIKFGHWRAVIMFSSIILIVCTRFKVTFMVLISEASWKRGGEQNELSLSCIFSRHINRFRHEILHALKHI